MRFILLFYALAVLLGGIWGHIRSASLASLISGVVFGLLLLSAAVGMFYKKRWAPYFGLAVTFVLDGFFTWRFLTTHKLFPPGLFSLLSLVVLLLLALSIRRQR